MVQKAVTKTIPPERKARRRNCCLRRFYSSIAEERRELKAGEKGKGYIQLNAEFQRLARRDKKAFFNEQWKEVEENNRMGKTRDLFKKIRDTKGKIHAMMGTTKDRNGTDLIEIEEIKKWQEHTEELYTKS